MVEKKVLTRANTPSGRFIKVCLTNIGLLSQYIETCSSLDVQKKKELLERLAIAGKQDLKNIL